LPSPAPSNYTWTSALGPYSTTSSVALAYLACLVCFQRFIVDEQNPLATPGNQRLRNRLTRFHCARDRQEIDMKGSSLPRFAVHPHGASVAGDIRCTTERPRPVPFPVGLVVKKRIEDSFQSPRGRPCGASTLMLIEPCRRWRGRVGGQVYA